MENVYKRFKSNTATQISETSHNEEAWLAYVDTGQMISFNTAFELKALNQ